MDGCALKVCKTRPGPPQGIGGITMGRYTTRIITDAEYNTIITTIKAGFTGPDGITREPNMPIATALVLEANLGVRINDILHLTLSDIIKDGDHWRLDIAEEKTGKSRTYIVPQAIYTYITDYCRDNSISTQRRIFQFGERQVQKHLKATCDYLRLENVSTHSFRKYVGNSIYETSGHDIELVRDFYQHSSVAVTQRYLKRSSAQLEKAIENHVRLM